MYKVHLVGTTRGQGKTKWLKNSFMTDHYMFSCPSTSNFLMIADSIAYAKEIVKALNVNRRFQFANHDVGDGSSVFVGARYDAIFVDEYHKMTPERLGQLRDNAFFCDAKDLYLAGDVEVSMRKLTCDETSAAHNQSYVTQLEAELNLFRDSYVYYKHQYENLDKQTEEMRNELEGYRQRRTGLRKMEEAVRAA